MKEFFPLDEVKKIFRDDYYVQQSVKVPILSQHEQSWVDMIKRKYMPSKVTMDEIGDFAQPQKHRKAIYYGATSPPSTLRAEPHEVVTGSFMSATSELSDHVRKKSRQWRNVWIN